MSEQIQNTPLLGLGTQQVLFVAFQDRVFLCSPGCPGTPSVDQAGLKLRDSPASASQVLGLMVCATNIWLETLNEEPKRNQSGSV